MNKQVKKAIIPAAGLGTRFLPATKAQPKEMLPIVDKPTIQYIVEEAIDSGIESVIIVTGRSKRAIEDHFDKSVELELELKTKSKTDLLDIVEHIANMLNVYYVRQKEPLGLGHAVYCARQFIGDEPFAVMLGDDVIYAPQKPCLKQMMEVYDRVQASVIGVQPVSWDAVSSYGIVQGDPMEDGLYRVQKLVEKPKREAAPTNIAVLGRYIITPDVFTHLENAAAGAGGEIQLTDALDKMAARNPLYAYCFEGKRYDVGSKIGFLQATVEYALRRDDLRDEFSAYLRNLDDHIALGEKQ